MPNYINQSLTDDLIQKFDHDYLSDSNRKIIENAVIKNGADAATLNNQSVIQMRNVFSNEIKTGEITSQKKSGRCWIFAGMNLFRQKAATNLKIKDFELSQNFTMFYDKLEKANYFLENIIETADEDIYSRVTMWLLNSPLQDGGQWDMFANLIRKYGVVPKYAMPETYHSSNTYIMNKLITLKLREFASELRKHHANNVSETELRNIKNQMISEVYRLLSLFLGKPPQRFDFEYRDDDENFFENRDITPIDFYRKYIGYDLDDFVSVINSPTPDKPYHKTYTVQYLGNVREGKPVLYLNVTPEELNEMAMRQIQDGTPVWFGCDVRQKLDVDAGILDDNLFLYEEAFGIKLGLDKGGRLDYGESKLNHAMLFTGVNLIDGKPNRWKVENSWGDEKGQKGFLVMSDSWFNQYNYQIVIQKKFLTEKMISALGQKPKVLPPWDPMGSLALMK